ncbi:MAG: hemolytic protein HlpA [Rhodothermia bacterium]|nr:MAG: hemolytic protein HlpA [Rhodothermia bacterium]
MTVKRGFDVPVLLVIYNRPKVTKESLAAIAKIEPKVLLVAADGPRSAAESDQCSRTRDLIGGVNWECDIRTRFSDENLGCGVSVHTAVDWALAQFEEIIVLEDDCIAEPSFFRFCEELLQRYRHDGRIAHIGGFNFQETQPVGKYSYFFSKYSIASGGWATWRRAWKYYDWKIEHWPELKDAGLVQRWCDDRLEQKMWTSIYDRMHEGAPDVWDYQWNLACWVQNGLAILPSVHLLTNIGFGPDATHTKKVIPCLVAPTSKLSTISHPPFIVRNRKADAYLFEHNFGGAGMRYAKSWRGRLTYARQSLRSPCRAFKGLRGFLTYSRRSVSPGSDPKS